MNNWQLALLAFGCWTLFMVPILAFFQACSDPMDEEYRSRWH